MRAMNKRPLSITVIGWICVAVGTVALVYHLPEFDPQAPFQYELVLVWLIRCLLVLAGVFILRGSNWARWLLVVWMAYHVVLSAFHSVSEVVVHGVLFSVMAYVLFRPPASAYFRGARAERSPMAGTEGGSAGKPEGPKV
jgi:hypothetical protein